MNLKEINSKLVEAINQVQIRNELSQLPDLSGVVPARASGELSKIQKDVEQIGKLVAELNARQITELLGDAGNQRLWEIYNALAYFKNAVQIQKGRLSTQTGRTSVKPTSAEVRGVS